MIKTNIRTVGWTGAYPNLSPKRPTASLVSRKVLTPLLGQVLLCILIQLIGFEIVRRQYWYVQPGLYYPRQLLMLPRFIPPKLNTKKTNVENSENTTLFLLSCFQYILSGIVLSVGPPFRQSMTQNRTYHFSTHNPSHHLSLIGSQYPSSSTLSPPYCSHPTCSSIPQPGFQMSCN